MIESNKFAPRRSIPLCLAAMSADLARWYVNYPGTGRWPTVAIMHEKFREEDATVGG